MISSFQNQLASRLRERLSRSGMQVTDLQEAAAQLLLRAQDTERCEALLVLREFDLGAYTRGTLHFLDALSAEAKQSWYVEFTRTTLLLGDPRRLGARFRFDYVSEDGSVAWVAPRPAQQQLGLKRLLKPLRSLTQLHGEYQVSLPGPLQAPVPAVELSIACNATLQNQLIHINHCLCESVIEGHLTGAGTLTYRFVEELSVLGDHAAYARVHHDLERPQLRLYGVLRRTPAATPPTPVHLEGHL